MAMSMPLAMVNMRKPTHGFSFLSYMGIGLHLAVLRAAGYTLLIKVARLDFAIVTPFYFKNLVYLSIECQRAYNSMAEVWFPSVTSCITREINFLTDERFSERSKLVHFLPKLTISQSEAKSTLLISYDIKSLT